MNQLPKHMSCFNLNASLHSLWTMIMLLTATTSSMASIFDHDYGNPAKNVKRCSQRNRQLEYIGFCTHLEDTKNIIFL